MRSITTRKADRTATRRKPISFAVDADEGAYGLIQSMHMALRDAIVRPILDVPDLPAIEVPNAVTARTLRKADRGEDCVRESRESNRACRLCC